MAITDVTDSEAHPDIFRCRVLLNAKYWQSYVNTQTNKVGALVLERDRTIKAHYVCPRFKRGLAIYT